MNVVVEREDPNPPPITQVVIYLTEQEARDLMEVTGSFSYNVMADHLVLDRVYDRTTIDRIHNVTNSIYHQLFYEFGYDS